jgi:hypothetical protein
VSPEELAAVDRSWADLRRRRPELLAHLETSFALADHPELAEVRARWLVDAVSGLVGLLPAPSRLGDEARRLATRWPVAGSNPTFAVEGQAWMRAAGDVWPDWTDETERAWHHAWLLLSDVLAAESLSPFAIPVGK